MASKSKVKQLAEDVIAMLSTKAYDKIYRINRARDRCNEELDDGKPEIEAAPVAGGEDPEEVAAEA